MSNGFCSCIDLASELVETLTSKLVEMDGLQMRWNGMAGAGETSLCSHLCGPCPWKPLLCCWYRCVIFSWKAQLLQPHQPDLSQNPNGSFHHLKQCEQWLALHKIWSLALSFVCIYCRTFDTRLFVQIILLLAAIFLVWQHVDSKCSKVLGVQKIKIIKK